MAFWRKCFHVIFSKKNRILLFTATDAHPIIIILSSYFPSIGGHPDDIMSLSKGLFTSGFTGCIHYMSIMKTLNNGDLNTGGEIEFNNPSLTEVTKGVTCEKMCMA